MCGLVDVLFTNERHKLMINTDALAAGDVATAAVLISFGAVLGRTTPLQLLIMAFIELILYAVNQYIVEQELLVTDVGGSMVVHTFGAYFGLTVAWMMGRVGNQTLNASEYHSDMFSMIGTLFLV